MRRAASAAAAALLITAIFLAASSPQHGFVVPPQPDSPAAPAAVEFSYGGSGTDAIGAVAADANGNIYLAGYTNSRDLPAIAGTFQQDLNGYYDPFVAKLDRNGRPVWSTYLGGNSSRSHYRDYVGDQPYAIAVDPQGNVYVGGATSSTNFPVENAWLDAPQASSQPSTDGFVAKLNSTGTRLLYSTYVGGRDGSSQVVGIAVNAAGDAWIAVRTTARTFPATNRLGPAGEIAVVKLGSNGQLRWATHLGSGGERLTSIAVDNFGQVHLGGELSSSLCPPPAPAGHQCRNAFVTKLDSTGSRVVYSTAVGGTRASDGTAFITTSIHSLAISASGGLVGAGSTNAVDLHRIEGDRGAFGGGGLDGFVVTLTSSGSVERAVFVGGSGTDAMLRMRIAVDPSDVIHFGLDTDSDDMPTSAPLVSRHSDGPLFRSDDRGRRWQQTGGGLRAGIRDMTLDAVRNILYVATMKGLFRTADGGETWRALNEGFEYIGHVDAVAVNPRNPDVLYAGSGHLYRSTDGGNTWTRLRSATAGVGGYRAQAIAISPHDGSVWVSIGNGIEVSEDGGATWQARNSGLSGTGVGRIESPDQLAIDPRRPGVVFGAFSGGIFATFDHGASWRKLTETAESHLSFVTLAIDPRNSDTIYAGTFNRGLLKTTDGGRTWSPLLPLTAVRAIAIDPSDPSIVYVGLIGWDPPRIGVMQTRDGGATWTPTGSGLSMRAPIGRIAIHPRSPERVYAGSPTYSTVPFVGRLQRSAGSPAGPPSVHRFASYLIDGEFRDVAVTPSGDTVVALSGPRTSGQGQITVVRLAR
jgi:photosystem II stability/assembly factor-like uncharacterized protein